ncbi:MAG: membrane bound O-acyl transferase family-domain-containing protein [Benjaminiella poitrasii]|nr:MAG: membrane bound O-acyl transferase family-domain-containing protein [Benjaminiella poitrasii]
MVTTYYPMSIPAYVATIMAPSFIFMALSIPVKRRNILQEIILSILWFAELSIPIYYAGQYPYLCLMSTSVWSWATGMKMGVWVFSMSMEERRQKPFVYTLLDWRKRTTSTPAPANAVDVKLQQQKQESPSRTSSSLTADYSKVSLWPWIVAIIKHELVFDAIEFVFTYFNPHRPIIVFSAFLSKIYQFLGNTERAMALAPAVPLTYSSIIISTLQSMIFCGYIQIQLQVTYDTFMITYAVIYKAVLPLLERWQLGKDSAKLNKKNVVQTKAILRRVRGIRQVKEFIEDTLGMPPLFNSPWTAKSLRDFWGRRWHTFYNDCFYRLGYQPIRWAVMLVCNVKPPRWLPALSVFVMSGLMHEYFLYAATGAQDYLGGKPMAACGLQFVFFVVQVCGISIGDRLCHRGFLGQVYTLFCMAVTCHLFVVPYLLTGYLEMQRFSFYRIAVNLYHGKSDIFASVF